MSAEGAKKEKEYAMRRAIAVWMVFLMIMCSGAVFAEELSPLIVCASVITSSEETMTELRRMDEKDCFFLENSDKKLILRADNDFVAPETENVALRIVYLDNGSNFIRVRWRARSTSVLERTRLIHKSNSGSFREAVVLMNRGLYDGSGDGGADIVIDSYDTHKSVCSEYISEIELVNLSDMGANEENGKKKHVLFGASSEIMERLALLPQGNAEEKASLSDINLYFEKITGVACSVPEATMGSLIKEWLNVLGYPTDGTLQNKAVTAGLIRSVGYAPAFFGRAGYEMQNFGVGTVTYTDSQSVFYDDLAGLLYDLLFMKKNGDTLPFMVQMAQRDSRFEEKLLGLNDTLISNTYYDAAGIQISEKTITDSLTGEEMTCLYMKGGNVNSTYVNEYASIDGENYFLCAAYDKRLDLGVPVLYNRKTKETTALSQTRNMDCFGMLMSKDNIAYWVEGATLYSYHVASGEKSIVFTEPDGDRLQEVPTITNDGKYITVFCGKEIAYQPNVVYRISVEDKSYQVLIDEAWTEEHFSGSANPFLGHVIINPENPDIVNFMHGGGTNVADRLWLYEEGNLYQPYLQKIKENGSFGEHITHAFWSLDGKRLYFLRPPASSDSVENGISYVDITEEEKNVHVLNGDYSYIHTSVDEGDRHFISDTQIVFDNGCYRNEIVLYSDVSKSAALLAYVPVWNAHPCHSHPTFTADGANVVFNLADEESASCMVAVMETKEICERLDQGEYNQNGGFAWLDARRQSGMMGINLTEDMRQTVSESECIAIEDSLSVEVFGSFVPKNESTVSLLLTYLDIGSEEFYIQYNTNSDSEYGEVKNKKRIAVQKTNTGEWRTELIVLEDARFRSANADNSDFVILSGNDTPLYVRQLSAFSGICESTAYSTPIKKDGKIYVPVYNSQTERRNLWAVAEENGSYSLEEFTADGNAFYIAELKQSDYDRIFVWENNLCPIDRRGSR